ncbi:hypothetical protein [Novosphingobium sp. AP12]|uniref:hypothetical protein n=1 Tax=Novosphingobium sp. AP12 TaxID=1144305 RepID=UPI000271E2B2|nr:hypothetical protein [Novosphingobium sp. AP12]EJL24693.1 hypothetical protein PMI02_03619 [Novosphingobium sp. AP12]
MKPSLALFGALALMPAMVGPLEAEARTLLAPLCGGSAMMLQIPQREAPPGPPQGPCCAKGCHSDNKRKRPDLRQ